MSVPSIPLANIPIKFAGPFPDRECIVTLKEDPEHHSEHPMYLSGSVPQKCPGYRYVTTVRSREEFFKSNNSWKIPLSIHSLDVKFPYPTVDTTDPEVRIGSNDPPVPKRPSFTQEEGTGYVHDKEVRTIEGTITGFFGKNGKRLEEPDRRANFEVYQKLILDPALANVYGDPEADRFKTIVSNVSSDLSDSANLSPMIYRRLRTRVQIRSQETKYVLYHIVFNKSPQLTWQTSAAETDPKRSTSSLRGDAPEWRP